MSMKSTTRDAAGPMNSNDDRRDPGPASIKWMAALGLKEGEWFHASKPALKAGMRPTFELKARVWCCGMLHTQSYQGECAMTKFRNKIIPLSPAVIAKELRDEALEFYAGAGKVLTKEQEKVLSVSRQHVRRVLVELEREGLAERRTAEGIPLRDLSQDQLKRFPIGKIRLNFFVRPLPSKTVPDVAINGYVSFAFLSPRESRVLNKILQRFELEPEPYVAGEGYVQETVKVAIAGYVERNNVALQDYRKAKDVATHTLKQALDVAISSERIVRNPVSNPTVRTEVPAPMKAAPPVFRASCKEEVSPSSGFSSSSKPIELKKETAHALPRADDDEKPKPEYASARDEVKAIYHAKTGTYPTVQVLDRIEGINTSKGETWDSYLDILKPHLGGNWTNPPGFLTHLAQTGFQPLASPPQEKPKPKCPKCSSDNQRGAVFLSGEIVPCPDCSTSAEWRDELAAKMKRPAMSKGT